MMRKKKKNTPILVVVKDKETRCILKEIIIEDTPFWPLIADSCERALAILASDAPEIAIVGVSLGIDCVRKLRGVNAVRLFVLLVNEAKRGYHHDVVCLKQPFDLDALLRVLLEPNSPPQHPSSHPTLPHSKARDKDQ